MTKEEWLAFLATADSSSIEAMRAHTEAIRCLEAEEQWRDSTSVGSVMESIRRHMRMPAWVAGRKSRLAACAILRLVSDVISNTSWRLVIERTEYYVERLAQFEEVQKAIDQSDDLPIGHTGARQLLACLVSPNPYSACISALSAAMQFSNPEGKDELGGIEAQLDSASSSIVRDIFGNPFRPITFSPEWRTTTAVAIAQGMYESRDFGPMPLLADALQDAGCEVPEVIDHCRGPGPHVRGCWVVDGVLGKA